MIHNKFRYLLTLVALFAMTAGAWADDWTNIVKNSDMEGTDVSCFYVKENAKGAGNMYIARITEGIGVDNSRAIKVLSDGTEANTWDTQFFIRLPYELPAGTKYKLTFDYKADKNADADFQCANEPGEYIIWYIGENDTEDFSFTTSWQNFSKEFTVPAAADGSNNNGGWKNNFQTIYFSLALNGEATEYIIDNVKVEVLTSDLASLTPSPVTAPDFMRLYVTDNEAKTEASFDMPASDMTVDYELVRDMAISMPVTVGDGNDGYRIRLKKSEQNPGKFEPAETDVAGMMALIKVHDAIENEDLIFFNLGGSVDCAVSIYAIDDNDQPVGDPVAFQDLVPGRYIAKATAATGSTYDGETANSNVFVLFQGFELEIAAGEYATFYKEEPLYVEDEDAKLYTISSVTDTEAVLSEQIIVAPALTPLLVYNSSDETKTFLLIASVEEADDVTPAEEFKGTLVAKTFSEDDMAAANHFVLTAAQAFVWVKNAGTIAANRCWLELPISAASNARVIVFGDATGIDGISDISGKSGDWFDLNGRKLQKMPTKKGIYILNGHKVVVK